MTQEAELAWQIVQEVCRQANPQPNPPGMEYILYEEYEKELLQACQAAVAAGVPASRLLEEVQRVYDQVDEPMYDGLAKLLMASADLDHDVGGQTLLHRLFKQPYPPRLGRSLHASAAGAQPRTAGTSEVDSEEEADEIGLPELLAKRPTPNLRDAEGNTVLHVLILHTIQAEYFPDVSTAGAMHLMPGESMENWDQRAKYVEGAFKMLVAAGWSITQPGINQMTPCHLLDMSRKLAAELVNSRNMKDMLGDFGSMGSGWGAAMEAVVAPVKVGRQAILQAFDNLLAFSRELPS
ncbi:hypothetical protein WJX74_003104 [Apatococcus lobatus]|uniref:Uncharacterized protein n=1 Tax=Apatococcus lobatus TaxID=904363 RepID=A0AAW1SG86_9CHLO